MPHRQTGVKTKSKQYQAHSVSKDSQQEDWSATKFVSQQRKSIAARNVAKEKYTPQTSAGIHYETNSIITSKKLIVYYTLYFLL